MNIDLSEEQKLIRTSAKEFLEKEVPKDLIRDLDESEQGHSPVLWKKMAELGWIGLPIPEAYDGMDMDFLDFVVLIEEIGYYLLPGPFISTALGALLVMEVGTEEQKKDLLPKISQGNLVVALAITEPTATYDASGIQMRADQGDDHFFVSGTKLFAENAQVADYLICPFRSKQEKDPENGISLFLVDAKAPGISLSIVPTMGLGKQCEINFERVKVPRENLLGRLHNGWEILQKTLQKAQTAKCAEMLGGIRASLDMTNAFVKKRITYGRTVGSYQVVQHYLANIWIQLETSRNITYLAAWKINEGLPCEREVSAAKAWVGKAFTQVTERCVQLHGALGLSKEHDIGLYYRAAMAGNLAYGNGDHQRNIIAKAMNF